MYTQLTSEHGEDLVSSAWYIYNCEVRARRGSILLHDLA